MVGKDCEGAFSKPAFCSAPLSMDRFEWIVNVMGRGILCRYSRRWHLRVPAGANAARNVGKFGNSASHSLTGQPLDNQEGETSADQREQPGRGPAQCISS